MESGFAPPARLGPTKLGRIPPMKMQYHYRGTFAPLALLALFAGVLSASAALLPSPLTFKAGIAGPTDSALAWYMARAAGLYDAQGLWVDILDMNGGSRGAEELQAGQIDIMNVGLSSVVHVN